MTLLSRINNLFTKKAPAVAVPAPVETPDPIHTMPDDNRWGHHIAWTNFDQRTIWGHFDNYRGMAAFVYGATDHPSRLLAVGETIRVKMASGRAALFRVTELDWQSNPPDMFFGKVEDIGYEDGEPELAVTANATP